MAEWIIDAVGPFHANTDDVDITDRAREMLLALGWTPPEAGLSFTRAEYV